MAHPIETRLAELGIALPEPAAAVANYVPGVVVGSRLLVSGQLPMLGGQLIAAGQVPEPVSVEDAAAAARQCAINGLAVVRATLGGFDRLRRAVSLTCFVACGAGFGEQPKVANGASDLLVDVLGEAGRHARAAVGAASLPLNAAVEVAFEFAIEPA